jgi:AraC family ethanolamine operon transcriptional activator
LETEKQNHRARLAGAVQREFRENLGLDFAPQEVADRLGVSRRSLEIIFRSFFQQTLLEYNKAVKLNSFRSALLKPENRGFTIGDVAAQFGIWHLGRLSSDYREFFGELPSESRKRLGNIQEIRNSCSIPASGGSGQL